MKNVIYNLTLTLCLCITIWGLVFLKYTPVNSRLCHLHNYVAYEHTGDGTVKTDALGLLCIDTGDMTELRIHELNSVESPDGEPYSGLTLIFGDKPSGMVGSMKTDLAQAHITYELSQNPQRKAAMSQLKQLYCDDCIQKIQASGNQAYVLADFLNGTLYPIADQTMYEINGNHVEIETIPQSKRIVIDVTESK